MEGIPAMNFVGHNHGFFELEATSNLYIKRKYPKYMYSMQTALYIFEHHSNWQAHAPKDHAQMRDGHN